MNEQNYILELKDVVKTFGGVTALAGVQFQLKKGEIHALMGENGAGRLWDKGVFRTDYTQEILNIQQQFIEQLEGD